MGAELAGPVAGGQTAVPSCRASCQPRACGPPLLWHPQGWWQWHAQPCCDAALVSAVPGWGCFAPGPSGSCSVPWPGSIAITFPCALERGQELHYCCGRAGGWAGREGGVLRWAGSAHWGCGSLVPPVLWVGSTGFVLWAVSRGAVRGSPWVCCRGGCSDCWVLNSCLGSRVGAWGVTWESWVRHSHGVWGCAAPPMGSVALEGEREQQAAADGWGTLPELLPSVPCPVLLRSNTAPHSCLSSGVAAGAARADVRAPAPGHGKVQPLCCSFSLQHPVPSPASANLLTPPCLALGASKARWVLVWDAGSDRGRGVCGCMLWGVRGISTALGCG